MTLRNQIISLIINEANDEKFYEATIEKSAIVSTFFLEPSFISVKSAHSFIQRYWVEIVEFKNNFMMEYDINIFAHPDTFVKHLIKCYARILLASISLESTVKIDEYFIRKLERLMEI